jgi:hypothetical protein
VAVSIEELMVSFGADTAGFERGAKRVKDGLKDVGVEAGKAGEKLGKVGDRVRDDKGRFLKLKKDVEGAGAAADKAGGSFGGFFSNFSGGESLLSTVGSNLANIKAGLDIAKDIGGFLFGLAQGAAEAGSKFHDLSIQTGLSVETLSGLQLQLKQSGTDMDALARATVLMQRNLGEAASGNKELQRAFASLGVKDVNAAMRDTDGTLRTVAKSLAEAGSAGQRNAEGAKIMGKGFKELSVFLEDTKGDLDGVIEESRRAGRVMSGEAADAADAFGDELDALTNSAAIAGRTLGIEAIPQITGAMRDLTGATEGSISVWREFGSTLGTSIEAVRVLIEGLSILAATQGGMGLSDSFEAAYARISRQRDIAAGNVFDLNQPGTPEQKARGARERARALGSVGLRPSVPGGDNDFFAPGPKGQKARKDELDKLKAFAKEWDFTVTALTNGKHNVGSAHYQGRAMDVSVRGKSDQDIRAFMEAAKQSGYGVRDERTRPEGQKVWSGPHVHLELLGKAAQAASKELDGQVQVLQELSRALAEGDLELQAFTQDTAEQQTASEYLRLGIGQLTGEAQKLGEALFAQRAEQIKNIAAAKEHEDALMKLVEANKAAGRGFNSEDLLKPNKAVGTLLEFGQGQTGGKRAGLSFSVDYWADFREQFGQIREEMKGWREEWQDGLLSMAANGSQIFSNFFMDLREGWKAALGNMAMAFAQSLEQMAAQAAASALWSALLNMVGAAIGGATAGGGTHGGASMGTGGKFAGGFATGGFIPPGQWGMTGERGPEPVFGGRSGATVMPNGAGGHVTINFHISTPTGQIPRETQSQIARRTQRALEAARSSSF